MATGGGNTSIAARIAALNLGQVGQNPPPSSPSYGEAINGAKPKPPPPALPQRRPGIPNSQSATTLRVFGKSSPEIGNQPAAAAPVVQEGRPPPALPPRRPTNHATSLPSQRPSETSSVESRPTPQRLGRQDSRESIASTKSGFSVASNKSGTSTRTTSSGSVYTIRAPAFGSASLPPLPPKRESTGGNIPTLSSTQSAPTLPSRPSLPQRPGTATGPEETKKRLEPPPPRKSALAQGFGFNEKAPCLPAKRPTADPPSSTINGDSPNSSSPPPIPKSSRPDLATLQASKPTLNGIANKTATGAPNASTQPSCLLCRDFTSPDTHAARFPRQSIPSQDPSWLANQLCSPFPSPTEKARAIFTWLHHNIAYNTTAFFAGNIQPSTPSSTISSGLAVCEGYAALFANLATHAGLQSRVISGHGKGYGYAPTEPGRPLPPYEMCHAWNVVLIDEGWKLLDACWGAGSLDCGTREYKKGFNASQFTMTNEDFGRSHFPDDRVSFYRVDGRCPGWEEYLLGEGGRGDGPRRFGGFTVEEGFKEGSFEPGTATVSLGMEAGKGMTRFSFTRVCAHWDPVRNGRGRPYCYVLLREGAERKKMLPFENNGWAWWVDVPARELGQVGDKVKVAAINSFDGGDGRGVTADLFKQKEGRVGMGWGYVCEWDLVA
ncbi:cytokinesis protein 3 [Sphaceloma murrayae]|uniref:Cytokinesis protein 3 n=1 Tax=Sphaceloma murrayae TaxID=2082308 RepID=A0A2K1QV55_9PEZI|nr:cytokinesis protein 3 [Sphaceloma murrayae]